MTLIGSISLSAQQRDLNYTKVSDCILLNYHPDSVALSKFCRIGTIFIKFKVNNQRDITNLSFSGDVDSTQFISDALIKAVNALKHNTALISFLKTSNRMIIQPFTYDYQAGCNFPKPGTKNTTDYYLSFIDIISAMNHTSNSLFHILNFKDGNMQFFDGVLLNPIVVNNVVMH